LGGFGSQRSSVRYGFHNEVEGVVSMATTKSKEKRRVGPTIVPGDAGTPFQVLAPDGSLVGDEPELSSEELLAMYRVMVFTREFNEFTVMLQRQGRISFFLSSSGQEATQIGTAIHLRKEDWVFSAYREHAIAFLRGATAKDMYSHLIANGSDPSLGRQNPGHYHSPELHLASPASPIGDQIPHAVGMAWGKWLQGERIVTMTYFGDGGTSSDGFHAGLNFAGVVKAATVFVCQNNGYAITVPYERQTAAPALYLRAIGYGMPGYYVDGNDILAVYAVAKDAVERARAGEGPSLIEAVTYRFSGHSTSDNPRRYRGEAEEAQWRPRDPLLRFSAYLRNRGLMVQEEQEDLTARYRQEIQEALRQAETEPPPPPDSVFRDVYADKPWHLVEQEQDFLRYAKQEKGH